MSELKTQPTGKSADAFLAGVADDTRRTDAQTVCAMMARVTGCTPKMWGESLVGFGRYEYTYASGHSGAWFLTGLSPRARNLTVYIMPGFSQYADLMARLGKHKHSKSCLYITNLASIDTAVLEELVQRSVDGMRARYETSEKT